MKPIEREQGTRAPAGGYIIIRAGALLGVWAGFRAKIIRLVDLRVWLACHELVARRTAARKGVAPRYTIAELHKLVGGVGGKRLEASVRRLTAAGFLHWTSVRIELRGEIAADVEAHTVSPKRLVPVPRRLVRYLAGGVTKVTAATVLGHLLRCVYYQRGLCTSEGACKASWVAATFGVDERNVKKSRARLVELGWLVSVNAPQWRMNRWGGRFCINLSWAGRLDEVRVSPPLIALSTTESPPPESDNHPLREHVHQKPAKRGPTGSAGRKEDTPPPTLRHLVAEDLADTTRLLTLHAQACDRGLSSASEAARLGFIALAEHARRRGSRNPCGLFAWLLARKRWDCITLDDEEAARSRLKSGPEPCEAPAALERLVRSVASKMAVRAHGLGIHRPSDGRAGVRGYKPQDTAP